MHYGTYFFFTDSNKWMDLYDLFDWLIDLSRLRGKSL